ncbi:unnamed protein product [Closterium sp. NIES-65]|nr:unnamed protein product [Closterium sp. NIES-65]
MVRVWGYMAQFLVPEQQRGGKLQPKAWWGLHLGVSEESKGWELLDITANRVVTTSDVVFYETLSLEVWKSELGPASGRTRATPSTDTSTATLPLLSEVSEQVDEDPAVAPASPFPAPSSRPLPVELGGLTSPAAQKRAAEETPDETAEEIAEETAEEIAEEPAASRQLTGEQEAAKPTAEQLAGELLLNGKRVSEKLSNGMPVSEKPSTGEPSNAELALEERATKEQFDDGTSSDVMEVQPRPRKSGRIRRPPDFFVSVAFTTVYDVDDDDLAYDDAEDDEEFSELDPDMHADPEHRWDIATMTALASWKGPAVKAAMEEEIRSLINMGTWELVERPLGVYGADYDERYAPVSSYVTLRIFLSIVAVLDFNLMQLDMKNAFLQSKLDRVLYMYQADYFNDGTSRMCKLLKSLYRLKQSPLLWYKALNDVLVLVYVDDLLAASSSTAMLKELKELLEVAFELREISPVQQYLGLEIVRDRPARKLWLHQQGYADKLRRRFIDEEQTGRTLKTPFAATTTRPDIEFACSKLGSGLTARSDQHWREVDRCLAYLDDTRDTALEFGGGPESLELVGYVDADNAGDKQNRMSTGGYVFVYGGAAVSWSSQRIKCAMLSLTESEYVAAVKAGKEGRRLRFLLAEFWQLDAGKPTVLRMDNKSAITVAEGMGLTGNLKHMQRRQAWLQHMVKCGKFSLQYIPTTKQPADSLTKALHYPAFNRCSVAIGHVRLADVGDGDNDVQQ